MRALKLFAGLGTALLLLALLAAWQVPSHLDWNRYRGAIATVASARLGRPVTIGGQIRLLVLPEAVLVADGVTLADRGDGVSAKIGALRLRIALGPLLRGRLVPRRLELDDPAVVLPWPLPRGAVTAVPPGVTGGFTASVEGGSLRLGGITLSGINGGVQIDPDTGAFAAQGVAGLAGLPWRFTALIGAPGADGISLLTVTLDGQGAVLGTGGTLRGRILAGGSVQGVLALRGDNLRHLIPGPALPWRLHGKFEAAEGEVRAPKLDVMLGASPGAASATLLLGAAPALTAVAHVGQIPLDGWGRSIEAHSTLPIHLDMSATAGSLMGGTLRDLKAAIDLGRERNAIKAEATLPGGGTIRLDGASGARPSEETLVGGVMLNAPDLVPVIAWLGPSLSTILGPKTVSEMPLARLAAAKLNATLHLRPGQVELTGITGSINGTSLTGHVGMAMAARPGVTVALALDRLVVGEAPAGEAPAGEAPAGNAPAGDTWQIAQAARLALADSFSGFDATLDVQVAHAQFGAWAFSNAVLQAQGAGSGIALHRLAADFGTAHLETSGAFGRDGTVNDGRLDLTAPDAAKLKLPQGWPSAPAALWQGPLHLGLVASGPPQAIAGQIRADLGDLRAEAEMMLDSSVPQLAATITIRHPGAPRLAVQMGLAAGADWPGAGSVAVLAHLAATPALLTVKDFSIAAGALRLSGHGDADFAGLQPRLTAQLQAQELVLPPLPSISAPMPSWLLEGWQGQIQVTADEVRFGAHVALTHGAAMVGVGGGAALADDVVANVAGGRFTGEIAIDTTPASPVWALRGILAGAGIDRLPPLAGVPLRGGMLDLGIDLSAKGNDNAALLATVSGHVQGDLHGASLAGIDLAHLGKLLMAHGPRLRAALTAALSSGDTGPLDGGFDSDVTNGTATIAHAVFTGALGSCTLAGDWDLPAVTSDVRLVALPAVPNPPAFTVRLSGQRRIVDVQPGLLWSRPRAPQGRAVPAGEASTGAVAKDAIQQ